MSHRTVKDVMTTEVRSVGPDDTVKAVAEALDAGRFSGVPVVDAGQVVGVVSEGDVLHKTTYQDDPESWTPLLHRHRVDRAKARATVAHELMTTPAVTISPTASIVEAARLMERRGVKRLPVVTADGALVGIVSRGDLVRMFLRTDEDIRAEVQREVLDDVVLLPPNSATASVEGGIVTLHGTVPRKTDAAIAVEVTRRIDGVVGAVDRLTFVKDDTTRRARHATAPTEPFGVYY